SFTPVCPTTKTGSKITLALANQALLTTCPQKVDSDLDFVCPTAYPTTHHPYPTTHHPYPTTHHPYPTTHHPHTTEDGSVFGSGCHSQQQSVSLSACGRAPNNPRIVGGQNAAAGTWPWVASLQVNGKHRCGGSLISDMWVLTAAHCFPHRKMKVVLGLESMSGPNLNNVSKAIDKIIVHPAYGDIFNKNNNDMALLKLSSPVTFTNYIQPVCLASANSTFYTGDNNWVVGFGTTSRGGPYADTLQEVRVPIVGNNECTCAYHDLTDNMICAGLRAGGNDSCQGDSGGPMMIKKGSVWIQSGVVSFGKGCALPKFPGVYARVSRFEDWIKNHTGSSKPGFVDYMSSGVDSDLNFVCQPIPTPTQHPSPTTQHPSPTTQHPSPTTQHPYPTT
ncbi:venom protease-like, partial [Gymnodraco acuticeps]|uniref:Venom protease-like n=1 Tax=Gymnodraco acuticeps TaxID=8218 RepID=A0A6P8U6N0_GYMAC